MESLKETEKKETKKISTGDPYGDYFMNRSVADIMEEYGEQRDE